MSTRFAFVGFRHPHINDMHSRCRQSKDIDVVACCEEDVATRNRLNKDEIVNITHDRYETLLDEVDCDVIAVGDCYGRRAEIIEAALHASRHVISDKPLCITLSELDRIEQAAADAQRIVGCMLDMRDLGVFLGLRNLIQEGNIGDVHAISFDGQHPLLYGTRPSWYFENGMHGGVLNDIIVHAVDFIPWATGLAWKSVVAARCWNATVPQHPDFMQCGQAMLTLNNDAGVICDVSYLTPDSFAYEFPHYWRFTIWGSEGVLSGATNSAAISLYRNGESDVQHLPLANSQPGDYLKSFLAEISGQSSGLHVSSQDARIAARISLQIQRAADATITNLELL